MNLLDNAFIRTQIRRNPKPGRGATPANHPAPSLTGTDRNWQDIPTVWRQRMPKQDDSALGRLWGHMAQREQMDSRRAS